MNEPHIPTWMGKHLDEYSKEELINIVILFGEEINSLRGTNARLSIQSIRDAAEIAKAKL